MRNNVKLPIFFKPLLWSYDFSAIRSEQDKKTIIVNAINYGNLNHWRWIIKTYGKQAIKKILLSIPLSELRPRVVKLISIIFSIKKFRYVYRRAD